MDILTNHRVSLNAAIWIRAHKFNPLAVDVVASLQLIAKLRDDRDALDKRIEEEEQRLRDKVNNIEQKQKGE